jgi:small subunit ribosomal protein S14
MDPNLRVPFQPKKHRPTGRENARCKRCGTYKGVIRKYGIYYCRRCFREIAKELGFEKR